MNKAVDIFNQECDRNQFLNQQRSDRHWAGVMDPNKPFMRIPSFQNDNGTVWYNIELFYQDAKWNFRARYSQMLDVHTACLRSPKQHLLADFPQKRFLNNTKEDFLKKRMKELEHYFSVLLQAIPVEEIPQLLEFISTNRPKSNKTTPSAGVGGKVVLSSGQPSLGASFDAKQTGGNPSQSQRQEAHQHNEILRAGQKQQITLNQQLNDVLNMYSKQISEITDSSSKYDEDDKLRRINSDVNKRQFAGSSQLVWWARKPVKNSAASAALATRIPKGLPDNESDFVAFYIRDHYDEWIQGQSKVGVQAVLQLQKSINSRVQANNIVLSL